MVALPTLFMTLALSAGGNTGLLDFYSDTCVPCRQMDPVVNHLASLGYPIYQVNVGRERALAAKFHVTQVPCFVMVVEGREVARMIGVRSEAELEGVLALAPRPQAAGAPPIQLVGGQARGPAVNIPAVQSDAGFNETQRSAGAAPSRPQSAATPGWRLVSPDWAPAAEPNTVPENRLIAATARIRVLKGTGISCGSGTVIDLRNGEALILTCGHIFRDAKTEGRIEVDLFGPGAPQKVPATLVHYNLERDLGLISIRTTAPIVPAKVAPAGYKIAKAARVFSSGCDGGAAPTVQRGLVTALDRFLGPPNVTATGMPVEGRSGGGLFSADGLVIGVCNAALREEKEGFYAALESIQAELDFVNFSWVYRPESAPRAEAMVAVGPPAMPKRMPPPSEMVGETGMTQPGPVPPAPPSDRAPAAAPSEQAQQLSDKEQATLDELRRRTAKKSEVIVIIRPKGDPQAPSEIVVVDDASPAFLKRLGDEAGSQSAPAATAPPTSVPVPGPRAAIANRSPAVQPSDLPDAPEWTPRWLTRGYRGE